MGSFVHTRKLSVLIFVATVWGVNGVYEKNSNFLGLRSRNDATPLVSLDDRTNCAEGDPVPADRVDTTLRVRDLIAELTSNNYSAYIIPNEDEHQSEYTSETDMRRKYISGFSGSAGTAVVMANGSRALWTDGRYFLQADDQLDCNWVLMKTGLEGVPSIEEYLQLSLLPGDVVSADGKLIGYGDWQSLQESLAVAGINVETSEGNLVDVVWAADTENPRPPYSTEPAIVHGLEYAGVSMESKLSLVLADLADMGADAMVLTALDEIAWLFNIRGKDVTYNPVVRSYAIVSNTSATLYVDEVKITSEVEEHLSGVVSVSPYDSVWTDLKALSDNADVVKILLPSDSLSAGCSYQIYNTVAKAKRLSQTTPTLLRKAVKNDVEMMNMRQSNVRDAVALCDFLAFLEGQMAAGAPITEVEAQEILTTYRAKQKDFMDLSFTTISGYGPHGAIIHYAPTNLTDVVIGTDSLYLLDSGGQYMGGTTDVTRTMHYGSPTTEMIDRYTRVLMGAIDFATLVFPQGTQKTKMDVLARRPLYSVGLNYRHGTSHGVGMFLSVHEPLPDTFAIGHVMSDEPGYYKDGEFGIRIENLVTVVETDYTFDVPYYSFEMITLVPLEPKLIDVELLTLDQLTWVNAYNVEVRAQVGAEMQNQGLEQSYQWLLNKTESLSKAVTQCPNGGVEGIAPASLWIVVALTAVLLAAGTD